MKAREREEREDMQKEKKNEKPKKNLVKTNISTSLRGTFKECL